jgi:hypothetical protein
MHHELQNSFFMMPGQGESLKGLIVIKQLHGAKRYFFMNSVIIMTTKVLAGEIELIASKKTPNLANCRDGRKRLMKVVNHLGFIIRLLAL